jgi:hypothetical protein
VQDSKFLSISLLALALAALLLGLAHKLTGPTILALVILALFAILFPFAGLLFAVPVCLLVYFTDSAAAWQLWEKAYSKMSGKGASE